MSEEVRTVSDTGGAKGVKPEAFALIPWEAMDEVARVYDAGAKKYSSHNWRRGYEWSKSFSAACRHLFAFWRGEDRDPELGTLHLAMAVFHLLGLITFSLNREKYGRFDDRYSSEPESEAVPDGFALHQASPDGIEFVKDDVCLHWLTGLGKWFIADAGGWVPGEYETAQAAVDAQEALRNGR